MTAAAWHQPLHQWQHRFRRLHLAWWQQQLLRLLRLPLQLR